MPAEPQPPPVQPRATCWRLLVCLALVACVCLASLAIRFDLKRRGPFLDKYQKVQPGMTQKEVEAILGSPIDEGDGGGFSSDHACTWKEGEQTIVVYFNVTETRRDWEYGVKKKRFYPKTMWETLWGH